MKHEVIERLETLLRDEGFTNLTTLHASHDVTISAAKGDTRLVTHVTDRVSVPSHAQPHDEVPDPSVIAVRPQVPGIPADPVSGLPAGAGGQAVEAASPRAADRSGGPVRAGPGEPTGPGRPGRTGPGRPGTEARPPGRSCCERAGAANRPSRAPARRGPGARRSGGDREREREHGRGTGIRAAASRRPSSSSRCRCGHRPGAPDGRTRPAPRPGHRARQGCATARPVAGRCCTGAPAVRRCGTPGCPGS